MNETKKRIISGTIIAFIYGLFFHFETLYFFPLFLFICVVVIIVMKEFYSMFLYEKLDNFNKNIGLLFGVIVTAFFYVHALSSFRTYALIESRLINEILDMLTTDMTVAYAVFLLMFIILGSYNIATARLKGAIYSISIVFAGIIYIPLTLSFIFLLRTMKDGVFFVWLVSFITVMTDIWGYTIGKLFGRHKLPLPVSPNKTWEGYVGAFILQLVFTLGFYAGVRRFFSVPDYAVLEIVCISVLLYITAVFGDLFESLIKRNADYKDSGHLLPGHGGLLDRVDSIMFAMPVFYFYLVLKG